MRHQEQWACPEPLARPQITSKCLDRQILPACPKSAGEAGRNPYYVATLANTALGYAIGCALAVLPGAALTESRTFERFVYPLLIGLQATPKVALVPIILVWFGFGPASMVVLVAVVCFFPLFVNTVNGIRRTDPERLEKFRHDKFQLHRLAEPARGSRRRWL